MNEMNNQFPEAQRDRSTGISIVWLIPLIAVLVGGWLAYRTISQKGPDITIIFNEAEGLEPGQTRIKYKEVDIGKVRSVSLTDDLSEVIVRAQLNRSMTGHINENSRFWIVRPRINTSGISGLTTLISGIHIAVDPSKGSQSATQFTGLDTPPDIELRSEGRQFTLVADSLGSLDRGSPVYYRQIQVGEVTQYDLSDTQDKVNVRVFVKAPYDSLVKNHTRFWNASGVNVELGAAGVSADIESLAALINGGIAFETPLNLDAKADTQTPSREQFTLHDSYRAAVEKPYDRTELFLMYFDGSVRGLSAGSPVEFQGIEVGKVLNIDLRLNHETLEVQVPVLVELHPDTITPTGEVGDSPQILDAWLERGLRAQLSASNLLTGQLFIDLSFHDNAPVYQPRTVDQIAVFPTVPATFDQLAQNATDLFDQLSKLPLREMVDDLQTAVHSINLALDPERKDNLAGNLNATLANLSALSANLNRTVPQVSTHLNQTLAKLNTTLDDAAPLVTPDSDVIIELRDMLQNLSNAAKSVESLTNYLERNPSALLYGKPGAQP